MYPKSMNSDDLRATMSDERERDCVLVDVRQPLEYQSGHIPGARLVPLTELDLRSEELAGLGERKVIFYCHSGVRSLRAAQFAIEALLLPNVYNLSGGIVAYRGQLLDGFPELESFDMNGTVVELIRNAIDLEKGTHRLYSALKARVAGTPLEVLMRELEKAEIGHARLLYDVLLRVSGSGERDFDALYDSLGGTRTESGAPVETLVEQAKFLGRQGELALLEMALDLELRAYETYKNLGSAVVDDASRGTLLDLAQQERRHVESIGNKMGELMIGGMH